MKKGKAVLGAVLGVIFVSAALAAHYGTWSCSDCSLNGATPDPDTNTFITSTVNTKVSRWNSGDTVTICNGTTCATYLMASVFGGVAGMQQIAKFPQGSGGGGGGGNEGGGGSYGGGGGCVASCGGGTGGTGGGGTVVVGDPEPLPPTHEV